MRSVVHLAHGLLLAAAFLTSPGAHAASAPKRIKVAVLDVKAVGSFEPKMVAGLSSLIASEATRHPIQVIGGGDVSTLIGFERQRQLLGCDESSCLAEIGGALGVEYLLTTEVSEVGGIWLLSMTALDVGKAQAARRLTRRANKVSGLVDLSVEAVNEVLTALLASRQQAASTNADAAPRISAPPAGDKTPAATVATPAASESNGSGNALAWTLGGTGVALLGGGVAFGLLAKSAYDDAKTRADTAQPFAEQKDAAASRMLIADVLYGAGAVALGVGLVLAFTGTGDSSASVRAAPIADGGALVVSGGF